MKVRIGTSTTKGELLKAFDDEAVGTKFGDDKISMHSVFNKLTGKVTRFAFLGEVFKETHPAYTDFDEEIVPLEMVKESDPVVAIFEIELDEIDFFVFERKALADPIRETKFESFVENIKAMRIFNLPEYNGMHCMTILTRIEKEELLGVVPV